METLCILFKILQHFSRREYGFDPFHERRLLRLNINMVGDSIHITHDFLTSFGKHEIQEKLAGIGMRRRRRQTRRVDIGKDRI